MMRDWIRSASCRRVGSVSRVALVRAVGVAALCLVATVHVRAATQPLYDDPRVVKWSAEAIAGKQKDVLSEVESDLRSAAPHPFSAEIWTAVHLRLGDLSTALAAADPATKSRVGLLPGVLAANQVGDWQQVLALWKAQPVATDLRVLVHVATVARRYEEGDTLYDVVSLMAEAFPDAYQTTVFLEDDNNDLELRKRYLTLLARPDLARNPALAAAAENLRDRRDDPTDRLAEATRFLTAHPRDVEAWRQKAAALAKLDRFDEAAQAYESSNRTWPFIIPPTEQIEMLVRAGRLDDARNAAAGFARVSTAPPRALEPASESFLVQGELSAGEKGEARRELTKAFATFPNDPMLQDLGAQLENASNRPGDGVPHARAAVDSEPSNPDFQTHLIDALSDSGDGDAALAQFRTALKAVPSPTFRMFYSISQVYFARSDWNGWVALWQDAIRRFPGYHAVYDNLALGRDHLGQSDVALEILRRRLATHAASAWEVGQFQHFAMAAMQPDMARSAIEWLRVQQHWNRNVWEDAASRLASAHDDAGIDNLWAAARTMNPSAPWAYEPAIDHLITQKRWSDAAGLLKELATRTGSIRLRALSVTERAYLLVNEFDKATSAQTDELVASEHEVDQNRAILNEGDYWWYTWREAIALGDEALRSNAYIQYLTVRPDNVNIAGLFESTDDAMKRFRPFAVWHYMDRDPFNPTKLQGFGDDHARWLGDPVGGLWAYERIKEINPKFAADPNNGIDHAIAQVYAALGDASKDVKDYLAKEFIFPSDRYVGWFDGSRAKAEEELGSTSVTFDSEAVRAIVTRADGETTIMESNLRVAKPTLIKKDLNYVRAGYDDRGNLTSVTSSSGQDLRLTYDDKDRIASITAKDGSVLSFQYNDIGKPVVIAISGIGEIDVTYDAAGNIKGTPQSTGGRAVATAVTERFGELGTLIRPFSGGQNATTGLPRLHVADHDIDSLSQKYQETLQSGSREDKLDSALRLAKQLILKVSEDSDFAEKARSILRDVLEAVREGDMGVTGPDAAVQALVMSHDLFEATGRTGLNTEEWRQWTDNREWISGLEQQGVLSPASVTAFDQLAARPLTLLPSARWLAADDLSNPGLWTHKALGDIVIAPPAGIALTAVSRRRNGDVVAAGTLGLYVRHAGYWQFHGFDESNSRFSIDPHAKTTALGALSLTEDASGGLWIGTRRGVILIDKGYDDPVQTWPSGTAAAFDAAKLVPFGDGVLAGGADGLRRFTAAGEQPLTIDAAQVKSPVRALRAALDNQGTASVVIAANANGIFQAAADATVMLSDAPVDDVLWSEANQRIFELRSGEIWTGVWNGEGKLGPLMRVADLARPDDLGTPLGLAEISGADNDAMPALLTDKGLALWRDAHFELLVPPGPGTGEHIIALTGTKQHLWLATNTGLLSYGESAAFTSDMDGHVYDIVSLSAQSAVAIARGDRIDISRNGAAPKQHLDLEATVLAQDTSGNLIANNGFDIDLITDNLSRTQTLFSARPTDLPAYGVDDQFKKVSSLLVASDGTIWVTAGPSLFRWAKGKVQEFSMFKDTRFFPAKSDALSRVIETIDHRIWVVASYEGHRDIGGGKLNGGLFEYTPAGFRRLDLTDVDNRWFITGYTNIDTMTAVVGTARGFFQHRGDRYAAYADLPDPSSYAAMGREHPAMWLGSRGARLGEGDWLFGTADGVVGLHDGEWFRPARLNALLPNYAAQRFGGSTVHAVATDPRGRIYVGTDLGLLIYSSGGWFGLVADDGEAAVAFDDVERRRLVAATKPLAPVSEAASGHKAEPTIRAAVALQQDISLIQAAMTPGDMEWAHPEMLAKADDQWSHVRPDNAADPADTVRLHRMLDERRDALRRALGALKREAPEFYDEIALPPIDADLWARLDQNTAKRIVIVEYVLSPNALHIRLSTPNGVVMTSVEVSSVDVLDRVSTVLTALHAPSTGQTSDETMRGSLAWLYDLLLRPIETNLGDRDLLLVVPDPQIADLPLSALLRGRNPLDYAVEHYGIIYLPSLQFAASMMAAPALTGDEPIERLGDGAAASDSAVSATRPWLHVPVPGRLEVRSDHVLAMEFKGVEGSTPLDLSALASGTHAGVVFTDLEEPGSNGEIERNALALDLARGQTMDLVVPLWSVSSQTQQALSNAFYTGIRTKHLGPADALSEAQRLLLRSGAPAAGDVRSWASFIVMGRP